MADLALQTVTLEFTSDNVSTTFVRDLTLPPVLANFIGTPPKGLVSAKVTNQQSVTVPTTTATIVGNVVTFSFATALPQFDTSSNTVIYTATLQISL